MNSAACRWLAIPLLLLLLLPVLPARAQSRRLQRLWAELARQPAPSIGRERALWALAWEKEVPVTRQDSLAAVATTLATQLRDSAGVLAGQVAVARTELVAGQREAAQGRLQPVLAAARRRHDAWLETLALVMLGRTYWGTAAHARALTCWQQAWAAAQRQPDGYWRVRTAILQGNFYDNYALGLPWYFRGLRLAEQFDCQTCQAEALGGIGYDYLMLQELTVAERYVRQALRLHRQLRNADGERRTLVVLANLYLEHQQYAAAEAAYRRAAALTILPGDSLTITAALAGTFSQQGRDVPARQQARRGLRLAQRLGNLDQTTFLQATLATISLHQGQLDSALFYGQQAYAHRQRGAERQVLATTCRVLAQAYAARGSFAQAYTFERRAQAYHDTLTNDKVRARVAQARYADQLEQQQLHITRLERDQARGQLRQQRQLAGGGFVALLLLGAAGGAAWALRKRQRRRVVALRAQLATDLHDEVGTLLTRVSVQAELLQNLPPAQQSSAVEGLLRNSRAAASTMRDVVWGIDARADSAGSLVDRMREYLHQTVGTAGWHTELEVSGWPDEAPLPAAVRQAVYRIFKEAVTNALRHARGATRLHVVLRRHAGQLHLTLRDDGQPAPVRSAPAGMGLRNMQQRAAALEGRVLAGAVAGGGFRVQVEVPIPD